MGQVRGEGAEQEGACQHRSQFTVWKETMRRPRVGLALFQVAGACTSR